MAVPELPSQFCSSPPSPTLAEHAVDRALGQQHDRREDPDDDRRETAGRKKVERKKRQPGTRSWIR